MENQDKNINEILLNENQSSNDVYQIYNLDKFFTNVYYYYKFKGYSSIVTYYYVHILNIFITLFFSLLLAYINWENLNKCNLDDFSCDVNIFKFDNRFNNSLASFIFWSYITIITLYLIWMICYTYINIKNYKLIQNFYNTQLNISDVEFYSLNWNDILISIEKFQDNTNFIINFRRIEKQNKNMIISRIMRKENYLISLISKNIIGIKSEYTSLVFNKSLLWNINVCILSEIIETHKYKNIKEKDLKQKLRIFAILNLIFSPFICMYIIINFFLNNAARYQKDPSQITEHTWTTYAQWFFRDYNEMSDLFETRLSKSKDISNKFIDRFRPPVYNILAKFFTFMFSSIVAIMILLGLYNEAVLSVTILDRNLWWYIAVFSGFSLITHSYVRSFDITHIPSDYSKELLELLKNYPKNWNVLNQWELYIEIQKYFKLKFFFLFRELLGVFLTPYFMLTHFYNRAHIICDFLNDSSIEFGNVGYICKYANFTNNTDDEKSRSSYINYCNFYN